MPKKVRDPVQSALEKYAYDPDKNQKKDILLILQSGFFLYGNYFCSMEEYEIECIMSL